MGVEDFHILNSVIRDGNYELTVLSKKFGVFTWPLTILFDDKVWHFTTLASLDLSEASHFGGKAIYMLTKDTEKEPEVDKPESKQVIKSGSSKDEPVVQYFLVGATQGEEDKLPEFLKRGYWKNLYRRRWARFNKVVDQMKVGDRIAVKRMKGKGANEMDILALGIITDKDVDGYTVYVKWVIQFKGRKVPLTGCVGTAYGPYLKGTQFISEVFTI